MSAMGPSIELSINCELMSAAIAPYHSPTGSKPKLLPRLVIGYQRFATSHIALKTGPPPALMSGEFAGPYGRQFASASFILFLSAPPSLRVAGFHFEISHNAIHLLQVGARPIR